MGHNLVRDCDKLTVVTNNPIHAIMLSAMMSSLFVGYQCACSRVNIICELSKCYSRDIIVCVLIDVDNSHIM